MRIQPRQQILEIWKAVMRSSWRDGQWTWGGRDEPNSISDAEQLLCLLLPAAQLEEFNLDRPDETAPDILDALRPVGGALDIPRALIAILTQYFIRYLDDSGRPVYSGGSYFTTDDGTDPTVEQKALDIVDSYAVSVTLSLAALGFAKVFRRSVTRADLHREVDTLEELARLRLSAAMVGLLRSFTVSIIDVDSAEGRALVKTVNQRGLPVREAVNQLRRELRETRASINDILNDPTMSEDLERGDKLFECGWSWGVVQGAEQIGTTDQVGSQPDGVAEDSPYLYFTVIAIDAIEELFSERTRLLQLLTEEQQRLSRALQLRWDVTRAYWTTVATFGGDRWPLEDVPWRPTDEDVSDYYTLQVTSLAVKGLVQTRGTDAELSRVGEVLRELAERSRIVRRPENTDDPKLALHQPGKQVPLLGSEKVGPNTLLWTVSEFSALVLERVSMVAGLLSDAEQRGRLLDLADQVWEHLLQRRLRIGAAVDGLWDQPDGVFTELETRYREPSWYYTERVVQSLVTTAHVIRQPPLRSASLSGYGRRLLTEAEHLYDKQLLAGAAAGNATIQRSLHEIEMRLRRARDLLADCPGTASVLAVDALRQLDEFSAPLANGAGRK